MYAELSVEHDDILCSHAVFLQTRSGCTPLAKQCLQGIGHDPPISILLQGCNEDVENTSPLCIWTQISNIAATGFLARFVLSASFSFWYTALEAGENQEWLFHE